MFLIRKRRRGISSYVALLAALVLVATEAYAGGNGIVHALDGMILTN